MSRESAVAFYEQVEANEKLQEKLRELGTQERIEEYVKGELGYDFSLEEMQKVIFEKNPEIGDEDLEAVVGGASGENGIVPGCIIGVLVGGTAGLGVVGLGLSIAAAGA